MAALTPTVLSRNVPVGPYRMTVVRITGTLIGDHIDQSTLGFQRVVAAWSAPGDAALAAQVAVNSPSAGDVTVITGAALADVTVIGR